MFLATRLLATVLGAGGADASTGAVEVFWTVETPATVKQLGFRWGLPASELIELNPELDGSQSVDPGTRLRVFVGDPTSPARAIGAPNRGRLVHGRPMPEGEGWRLRPVRRRSWGTRLAVTTLVEVLGAYRARYPDGPPIAVGELARRRGGEVDPHAAHRTGRDVDLGFVLDVPHPNDRFLRVPPDRVDVEKTWFVVRTLLRSGRVQKIFMSAAVQRRLLSHARRDTPETELARYFAAANPDPAAITLIRHRRSHRDHMHVRFTCAPKNRRCRPSPVQP